MTEIKICGITNSDQAQKIASLDINAIGIVGVKNSPRFISEEIRKDIFQKIAKQRPELRRVWVVVDIEENEIKKALECEGAPNVIQLHGNETQEDCEKLRKMYPYIEWWKAIRIKDQKDISLAKSYENVVDQLLIDAWSQNNLGGTGYKIPLEYLKEINFKIPWWLAGGINAEWIPTVLNNSKPFGVDASSLIEKSPGIKDIKKVKLLINSIKTHDRSKR